MGDDLTGYIRHLEMMAFFSGYPLIYAAILFLSDSKSSNVFRTTLVPFLPCAYALAGTLYLGLQLKNLYPDYSFENMNHIMQQPYLVTWGMLAIFFWIPALAKKTIFSLIHSFVFFFFLVKDMLMQSFSKNGDNNILKNDMKLYSASLVLNLLLLALVALIYFLAKYLKKQFKR